MESASDQIESVEELYDRMQRFIWWRAHQMCKGNENHILLEVDDVASEMFATLVECWNKYKGRKDVNGPAMIRIVKASCDNTCRSLIIHYYLTKKRHHDTSVLSVEEILQKIDSREHAYASDISASIDYGISALETEIDVESLIESENMVNAFIWSLPYSQRQIVTAILCMDSRIARRAVLEGIRKEFVLEYPGPVRCNYRLIADALGLEYKRARYLWGQIRKKWKRHQENWMGNLSNRKETRV